MKRKQASRQANKTNTKNKRNKELILWKDTQDQQTLGQTNWKRVNIQIKNIQSENGTITIDTSEIRKIIRSYLKNKYSTKLENLNKR